MRRNDLINDDRQLEYATLMNPDKVYKQAIKPLSVHLLGSTTLSPWQYIGDEATKLST